MLGNIWTDTKKVFGVNLGEDYFLAWGRVLFVTSRLLEEGNEITRGCVIITIGNEIGRGNLP